VLATATFHFLRRPEDIDAARSSFGAGRQLTSQQRFELFCAPTEEQFSVRPAFKVGAAVFTIVGGVWFLLVLNYPHIKITQRSERLDKLRKKLEALRAHWWMVVAVLSLVGMWTYLALFTRYRQLIVSKAGITQQDTRWSFGQVLALATWAPVVVDFAYIFVCESLHLGACCRARTNPRTLRGSFGSNTDAPGSTVGSKVGLQGRISWPWEVTLKLEGDEDDGVRMTMDSVKVHLLSKDNQPSGYPNDNPSGPEHIEMVASPPPIAATADDAPQGQHYADRAGTGQYGALRGRSSLNWYGSGEE
jgi:hypothetical protein